MDEATATAAPPIDSSFLDKLLKNQLSEADARVFVSGDPERLVFTLLAIQQCIANASQAIGPNTPSAAIPPFAKPPAKPKNRKGKKKRGGQPGHTGRTREPLPEFGSCGAIFALREVDRHRGTTLRFSCPSKPSLQLRRVTCP